MQQGTIGILVPQNMTLAEFCEWAKENVPGINKELCTPEAVYLLNKAALEPIRAAMRKCAHSACGAPAMEGSIWCAAHAQAV